MRHRRGSGVALMVVVALAVVVLTAFQDPPDDRRTTEGAGAAGAGAPGGRGVAGTVRERGSVTLAFAGDVHFEGAFLGVPDQPGSTLGPMSRVLRRADVAVVNLESALTSRGRPASKELEDPSARYWFRSPGSALGVLERSGVDAVSIANNHGADYGVAGLRDAVRLDRRSPVAVVGVGLDAEEAFAPHRVRVRGTDVAVHAADASPRESDDPTWAVGPRSGPGLASARSAASPQLVAAVRDSAARDDLVVVYLHWGEEGNACPTPSQRALVRTLSEAGADVVVGTHAHVPLGAGRLGSTYVSYGLGNFFWYHGRQSETGVLRLTVTGDEVVGDEWVPARIRPEGGAPVPLAGAEAEEAVRDWRALRGCTDLARGPGAPSVGTPATPGSPEPSEPSGRGPVLPAYAAEVRRISPTLAARMTGVSHRASCPVPLRDLRLLRVTHVGFDGRAHRGALVVHEDVARDVVGVFGEIYRARFPIRRMRLVDAYDGDDDRSMAANNTSGYNCRTVAGQSTLSDHAYGRALDLNPVQNPYVTPGGVLPPAGASYVDVDRSRAARDRGVGPDGDGVIRQGDVVTRAFARIGWTWGGTWRAPDYQHFATD